MPFTLAHPAAIFPFSRLSRKWASLTALVIGSVIPDFEYFFRLSVKSTYSHTWNGMFWFDLPMGFVLFLIYQHFIKYTLIDHLPPYFRFRFAGFKTLHNTYSVRYILVIAGSLLIGIASHLLWDSFTHPFGYFVTRIAFLNHWIDVRNHRVNVYNIIQHGSTIVGLVIILMAINTLPPTKEYNSARTTRYWAWVAITALITLMCRYCSGLKLAAYGDWIVTCIAGCLFGVLFVSIIFKRQTVNQ